MKKTVLIRVLTVLLIMTMWIPSVSAASMNIRVVVNGKKVDFPDAKPYMDENNRVLIPIRFVSEELGAEVEWEESSKKVTITDSTHHVTLIVGKKEITVNDKSQSLDTAATMREQRTFVPLRFVSEALGAVVEWDSKAKTVYINNDGKKPVKEEVVEFSGFSYVLQEGDEHIEAHGYTDESIWTKSRFRIIIMRDESSELLMVLQTYRHYIGADYKKQCEELEELLSQNISPSGVQEIMSFINSKPSEDMWLHRKSFFDGNYEVAVGSPPNSVVELHVYKR